MAAEGRPRLRSAVGGSGVFSLSIFRLDFRLARWCSLSIGGGSRPARAIYFLWIGDGRATPRLRLAARAPAPPLWVTLLCALRNCSASTISVTLRARAREAPGADSRSRFHCDAEAAAGRPRPRAATLGHAAVRAQELLRVNHFRYPRARAQAPGADSRSRFHFLVSAARRRRCRGWRRWPPMVPAAELNRGRATRWLPKAARASAPP